MTGRGRVLAGLAGLALLATACGEPGPPTPSPSATVRPSSTAAVPDATDRPFVAAAWPEAGSACDVEGYSGRLGRVEAVSERAVRFVLCRPDGAFPARLAHPALGILDSTAVDAIARDPAAARLLAGAGTYRVEAWTEDNVRLVLADGDGASAAPAATPMAPGPTATGSPRPGASASPAGSVASPAGSVASPAASPGSVASPSASPGSVASPAGSVTPGGSGTAGASPAPGASGAPGTPPGVVILRWASSSPTRAAALRGAEVDGIDDPSPADAQEIGTLPELVLLPRPGLATAYLGFGGGRAFGPSAVRRAFAQGVDREALVRDAFPPGSVAAEATAPCAVPGGCEGLPWYEFNGPQGIADLALAGFDTQPSVPLHLPDAPVPGLPDPRGVAEALATQLAEHLGVTVELVERPADELRAAIAAREVTGLYLWGVTSSMADASGFLEPLVGAGAAGNAANRAREAREPLRTAAATTDPAARAAAFAVANDAVRASVAIVPLAHPGTAAAYRADVTGVAISPLGTDPLGAAVPGDRRQLVVMGAAEPAGTWCAIAVDPGSLRLCALVTPGLYAFDGASLDAVPALARRCTPSDDGLAWTCRLRDDLVTADGKRLDAGDVLATFRAAGDAGGGLRAALPADRFAAWDDLLGAPLPDVP